MGTLLAYYGPTLLWRRLNDVLFEIKGRLNDITLTGYISKLSLTNNISWPTLNRTGRTITVCMRNTRRGIHKDNYSSFVTNCAEQRY